MKKTFSILSVIVLSLSILAGCSKPVTEDQNLSAQPAGKIAAEFTDAEGGLWRIARLLHKKFMKKRR